MLPPRHMLKLLGGWPTRLPRPVLPSSAALAWLGVRSTCSALPHCLLTARRPPLLWVCCGPLLEECRCHRSLHPGPTRLCKHPVVHARLRVPHRRAENVKLPEMLQRGAHLGNKQNCLLHTRVAWLVFFWLPMQASVGFGSGHGGCSRYCR